MLKTHFANSNRPSKELMVKLVETFDREFKTMNRVHEYFEDLKRELQILEEARRDGFTGLLRPQIVYLYSTIDALAFATLNHIDSNKDRFIEFCKQYIIIEGISAEDIYDNRCGVVHSLTYDNETKRKKNKHQKRFFYIYDDVNNGYYEMHLLR